MSVGIEAINAYMGSASLNTRTLFEARGLDLKRFDNLMMIEKSVSLPCEDPVTFAVNAAKPIVDALSADERDRIELVITATESGLDFAKSLSTYVHEYLQLSRRCRLFEIKQACYGGTAALQMAANYVASQVSPGAKALVISTDVQRSFGDDMSAMSYSEPAAGIGAVAMLVSDNPVMMALDFGANGIYGHEVMDTCRPDVGIETGHVDLSLSSYLDCLSASYDAYVDRVEGVDFQQTFDYLAFHAPFAGLVKGAHRNMMRQHTSCSVGDIEADFEKRMQPSLQYCSRVGNIFGATVYLGLCSLIDHVKLTQPCRIGLYSYGSGCSAEFYSGVITPTSQMKLQSYRMREALDQRYQLSMSEYDALSQLNQTWLFGVKDREMDYAAFNHIYDQQFRGKGLLTLKNIGLDYKRYYVWS